MKKRFSMLIVKGNLLKLYNFGMMRIKRGLREKEANHVLKMDQPIDLL